MTMNTQIDFEQARSNMIKQQIRPWDVADLDVLDLLNEIHREDFVPAAYKQLALADLNIPLANDQVMMAPKLEARLLQALAIRKHENVLEVGTGSAYLTALLASSARHVDSIDIFTDFVQEAKAKLDNYQLTNVQLETSDLFSDWQAKKLYEVIVVTGSLPRLDPSLQEQLTSGGRLLAIVGEPPVMETRLITRVDENEWRSESLFETDLPVLVGAEKPSSFQF